MSLLDTAVSMLSYFAIWTLNRDWRGRPHAGLGHQTLVPAQNFPTRDGWIVVFCNKDKFWRDLVEVLGAARTGATTRASPPSPTGSPTRATLVAVLKERFARAHHRGVARRGCAGACRARPSTTCARRSPTSRCWRAR